MSTIVYNPPQLTTAEIHTLSEDAKKWIAANGFMNIPKKFFSLVMENARLVKENNELRGMLEIPPRPTYTMMERKS